MSEQYRDQVLEITNQKMDEIDEFIKKVRDSITDDKTLDYFHLKLDESAIIRVHARSYVFDSTALKMREKLRKKAREQQKILIESEGI